MFACKYVCSSLGWERGLVRRPPNVARFRPRDISKCFYVGVFADVDISACRYLCICKCICLWICLQVICFCTGLGCERGLSRRPQNVARMGLHGWAYTGAREPSARVAAGAGKCACHPARVVGTTLATPTGKGA